MKHSFLISLLLPLCLLQTRCTTSFVLPSVRTRRRAVSTSGLWDSEKPDPLVGLDFNATAASKQTAAPEETQQEQQQEQHHHHHVYKVPALDKELWFDEDTLEFFEASSSSDEPMIPIDTLLERSVDTVEDAAVHARRIPYEKGWVQDVVVAAEADKVPTVVVLGSGWASHALIKVADTFRMRLIVISPTNHFVFTPMLASSAVGTVEYRSMTEAIRVANPLIENYIEGKAIDIDVKKQTLQVKLADLLEDTRSGEPSLVEIPYDKLVVAVGCKVLDTIVPGADKHCYKLKSCEDARKLRSAIGECLEFGSRPSVLPDDSLSPKEAQERREMREKRLTWVIVGAGPTGVELAGELTDFIKDITQDRVGPYHKLKNEIRIILVEGGPCVLPPFDESLRDHAYKSLVQEGVDVRLNTFVKEVGDGWIKLQHKDGGPIDTIDFGLSVWAAGVAPVPFVETLLSKLPEEARGRNGRIKVDRWLRCPTPPDASFGSVLVMGDAAAFDQGESVLPQTAQVAAQQGAYVARLLNRGYDLSISPPTLTNDDNAMSTWLKTRGLQEAPGFRFLNLGILAYLGEGQALSQIHLGDKPIFMYAGSIAFMLWRSVYLVKQVATRNRVLVLFDWFKCKLFGRDITRL